MLELPKINLDCSTAISINTEIYELYIDNKKEFEEGYEWFPVYYDWYADENILSVIIQWHGNGDFWGEKIYNIDLKTGAILTNRQLLKLNHLSEEDAIKAVESYVEKILGGKSDYTGAGGRSNNEMILESKRQTEYSLKNEKTVFINKKGKLSIYAKMEITPLPGWLSYALLTIENGEKFKLKNL